jgi:hypothetical protein
MSVKERKCIKVSVFYFSWKNNVKIMLPKLGLLTQDFWKRFFLALHGIVFSFPKRARKVCL